MGIEEYIGRKIKDDDRTKHTAILLLAFVLYRNHVAELWCTGMDAVLSMSILHFALLLTTLKQIAIFCELFNKIFVCHFPFIHFTFLLSYLTYKMVGKNVFIYLFFIYTSN
jgi:hypothetical protein